MVHIFKYETFQYLCILHPVTNDFCKGNRDLTKTSYKTSVLKKLLLRSLTIIFLNYFCSLRLSSQSQRDLIEHTARVLIFLIY